MRSLFLSLLLVPALAFGQGVTRYPVPDRPKSLWCLSERSMANGGALGGYVLDYPLIFTKAGGQVTTVSGGGAGNTVITLTDGTNTCTLTFACTTTASGVTTFPAAANGSGTGCTYAAGATVTASVTTGGCTTTQPTFRNLCFVGRAL